MYNQEYDSAVSILVSKDSGRTFEERDNSGITVYENVETVLLKPVQRGGYGGSFAYIDKSILLGGVLNDLISPVIRIIGQTDECYLSTTLTEDLEIRVIGVPTCLSGSSIIKMYDGSEKYISELKIGDTVLSYNPKTMQLGPDIVMYTDAEENKVHTEYDIWFFTNGYKIETVHRHRLYNIEKQSMVYMDEWDIGNHALTFNGEIVELLSRKTIHKKIQHYTIFTKNQNYFANELLCGNRYTPPMLLRYSK